MSDSHRVVKRKVAGAFHFVLQYLSQPGTWVDLISRKEWHGLRLGAMAWYRIDIEGLPVITQGKVD